MRKADGKNSPKRNFSFAVLSLFFSFSLSLSLFLWSLHVRFGEGA